MLSIKIFRSRISHVSVRKLFFFYKIKFQYQKTAPAPCYATSTSCVAPPAPVIVAPAPAPLIPVSCCGGSSSCQQAVSVFIPCLLFIFKSKSKLCLNSSARTRAHHRLATIRQSRRQRAVVVPLEVVALPRARLRVLTHRATTARHLPSPSPLPLHPVPTHSSPATKTVTVDRSSWDNKLNTTVFKASLLFSLGDSVLLM